MLQVNGSMSRTPPPLGRGRCSLLVIWGQLLTTLTTVRCALRAVITVFHFLLIDLDYLSINKNRLSSVWHVQNVSLQLIDYYVKEKYTLRYTGGMVPDVNQVYVRKSLASVIMVRILQCTNIFLPETEQIKHHQTDSCFACMVLLKCRGSSSSSYALFSTRSSNTEQWHDDQTVNQFYNFAPESPFLWQGKANFREQEFCLARASKCLEL